MTRTPNLPDNAASPPGSDSSAGEWPQYLIAFPDRAAAEQAGTAVLGPALAGLGAGGWWFLRKTPDWRLRVPPHSASGLYEAVVDLLDSVVASGRAIGWRRGIYEPETTVFGGPDGIAIAHELAHLDSRHALTYLGGGTPLAALRAVVGRREIGTLLAATLLRGAGLDWYEQGDVWAKITQHRPLPQPGSLDPRHLDAVRRLLIADTESAGTERSSLAPARTWFGAFETAGNRLAGAADRGDLQRGLRAVAAHHVLFCWNRLGLSLTDQHTLARLATAVVMHDDISPAGGTITTDPTAPASTPPADVPSTTATR